MPIFQAECYVVVTPDSDARHITRFKDENETIIEVSVIASDVTLENHEVISRAASLMNRAASPYVSRPIFSFAYPDGKGGELALVQSEFPTPEAARAEALRSAKDLYVEAVEAGQQPSGWAVKVRDNDGKQICEISFDDVKGMAVASSL